MARHLDLGHRGEGEDEDNEEALREGDYLVIASNKYGSEGAVSPSSSSYCWCSPSPSPSSSPSPHRPHPQHHHHPHPHPHHHITPSSSPASSKCWTLEKKGGGDCRHRRRQDTPPIKKTPVHNSTLEYLVVQYLYLFSTVLGTL